MAVGAADYSFKIISSFVTESDENDGYKGVFSNINNHSEVLYEIKDAGGWVESVSWSLKEGLLFAFAGL